MIISNDRFLMGETESSLYASQMTLTIRQLHRTDFGGFKCISKNSIGDAEGTIRLYEMESTKKIKSNQKPIGNDIETDEKIDGLAGGGGNGVGNGGHVSATDEDGLRKKINIISRPHLYKSKNRNSTSIPFSASNTHMKPSIILMNIVFLINLISIIKRLS